MSMGCSRFKWQFGNLEHIREFQNGYLGALRDERWRVLEELQNLEIIPKGMAKRVPIIGKERQHEALSERMEEIDLKIAETKEVIRGIDLEIQISRSEQRDSFEKIFPRRESLLV